MFGNNVKPLSFALAFAVTIVFTDKKLGDKLTYAAKIAQNGIVIGESEVASGALKVKDFTTGETSSLNLDA